MKPYGNKYDSELMKKEWWQGAPGCRKGRSTKKAARRAAEKEIVEQEKIVSGE